MSTMCPEFQCPSCGHKWLEDDYYEVDDGCILDCPNCEVSLEVCNVETVRYWDLKIAKADPCSLPDSKS